MVDKKKIKQIKKQSSELPKQKKETKETKKDQVGKVPIKKKTPFGVPPLTLNKIKANIEKVDSSSSKLKSVGLSK